MKLFVVLSFLVLLSTSCKKNKIDVELIKKECISLKPGFSNVKLFINNATFYDKNLPFRSFMELSENHIKGSLLDSLKGNVMLVIQKNNWPSSNNLEFTKISSDDYSRPENIQLMIGKLKESEGAFQAEGYLFENGKIKFEVFTKDLIILSVSGFVIKPGNASIKENYIPITGYIAMKQITFETAGKPITTFFK
jgi:hypothetical protein